MTVISNKDDKSSAISVIIPTLNEVEVIEGTIESVARGEDIEIVVVDGGSGDGTFSSAARCGADKLFSACPSRGAQMDLGAEKASGEIFLFLHADTRLPDGWDIYIRNAIAAGNIGGGFKLSIDSTDTYLYLVTVAANVRSKVFGITYGDQAIFVKRDAFITTGGFKNLSLFEDIDLWRRLKKSGKLVILPAAVTTSQRRWNKKGRIKNTLKNWGLVSLYYLGVSPERLYKLYYNKAG
jgi:rSAM/selenodomain-associated transferase 2